MLLSWPSSSEGYADVYVEDAGVTDVSTIGVATATVPLMLSAPCLFALVMLVIFRVYGGGEIMVFEKVERFIVGKGS